MTIRPVKKEDWDAILRVAHESAPWDIDCGNQQWLANRRAFADLRMHYVTTDKDSKVVAYGAIEETPEKSHFRLFIVTHPDNLDTPITDELFKRLLKDLVALKANRVWTREYSKDALNQFFQSKGFKETQRLKLPDHDEMTICEYHFNQQD